MQSIIIHRLLFHCLEISRKNAHNMKTTGLPCSLTKYILAMICRNFLSISVFFLSNKSVLQKTLPVSQQFLTSTFNQLLQENKELCLILKQSLFIIFLLLNIFVTVKSVLLKCLFVCLFVCNRGDTIQYHNSLQSRELGQAPMLQVFLTPMQALSSYLRQQMV